MNFLKQLLALLLWIIAPIVLVVVGAAITAFGISHDWEIVVWTGIITAGFGLLWGSVVWFFVDSI